ncbi:hypothetical protein L6452_13617 [Arctium lappa]|uniref:Uncharacterized protein n=1 Tax=Arctium lappa TaxID=4217 RepID=A0ACB9CIP3_ARCLA|nr:hypothetical protein L6452_13617 [Arctium lappa]
MWKRASEALKDQCSLFITSLAPRSALRNPDIEAAVVKATSHDDSHIDYVSAQRIFMWIRVSGDYLHPVLSALSYRMKRTRSWTVVLKGLMLLHGVFTCKVPAIQKIGQLPFDLSNLKDRNPDLRHHEAFIRAYYTYLEKKSLFMFHHLQEQEEKKKREKDSNEAETKQKQSFMMQDLEWIEKLQGLLDVLLKIRPNRDNMMKVLVLEAMDCIMIEIFDIYSRICNGIAAVLVRIYTSTTTKAEATKVMSILKKAMVQGEDLSQYINLCSDLGVMKAKKFPKIHRIPKEDIGELENIIKKDSDQPKTEQSIPKEDESIGHQEDEKSKKTDDEQKDSTGDFETTITDNWELVDEEQRSNHDPDSGTKNDAGINHLAKEALDLITSDSDST